MISLTVNGAKQLTRRTIWGHLWVKVSDDAAPFIAKGKSIFAKHVVDADPKIRPQEEVVVLSRDARILAVGKAILTGKEMKAFKRGLAARARRGAAEK